MRFAPGKISVVAVLLAAVAAPQATTPSKVPRAGATKTKIYTRNIQVSFVFGQMTDLGKKKHYSASYCLNIWVIGPKGVHW